MCGRQSSYSLQKHFLGIFGLFLCPLCTSDVCWYFRRVELTRRKVCDCPDLAAQQRHFVPSVVRDRRKLSGTFILLISVSYWLIFPAVFRGGALPWTQKFSPFLSEPKAMKGSVCKARSRSGYNFACFATAGNWVSVLCLCSLINLIF